MVSPQEVQVASCMVGLLDEMGERSLEELMLEAGSDRIFGLAQACAARSAPV
jgi:hypothetical protein